MKDILVLVTLQPLLRAIQKYILEEDRARVDIQYCKNLNGIIDFIDKKLPSSVEVIISTPGPSFFIAQLIKKKIPILPLEYNNIDIIKSLHMALSVCPGGVAYGHYLQETQWLDDIRKMVGQDFGNFLFGNDASAPKYYRLEYFERGRWLPAAQLRRAAEDPDVISVKITIYRLASTSKVAHALCRAAENGKEVTVLMELRARFDEENNISWSKVLEDSGCQIIYGVEGYKCHSKICLITVKKGETLSYITQIGTGNYNEKTNRMYTDLSMMTADPQIGLDGTVFFQNMLLGNLGGNYKKLLTAPSGIRPKLLELIDREIQKGSDGYIFIKANAMTERSIIDKLAEASRAGVRVDLMLRGICCLLPGIPGHTENVHVTSIVGRYLEHARIYWFGKGEEARIFLSSADMMSRNLKRRVEIACPVQDPELRKMVRKIVETQQKDNVKASFMLSDGTYQRKAGGGLPVDSQTVFMEKSLHTGSQIEESPEDILVRRARLMKAFQKLFVHRK